jgi:hypothetical protein
MAWLDVGLRPYNGPHARIAMAGCGIHHRLLAGAGGALDGLRTVNLAVSRAGAGAAINGLQIRQVNQQSGGLRRSQSKQQLPTS